MESRELLATALQEFGSVSADYDVAEANLLCAVDLPGAHGLDVRAQLARLDDIAADVRRIIFLKENYDQFLNNPGKFHDSQAYFCIVCMISVLKTKYRVGYSAKWKHVTPETEVPDDFGRDSRDQFIHAILDGEGGTCGSLPVLIVAVGRRIGMPLKLVKAYRILFIRWDDPKGNWNSPDGAPNPSQGEVFNIEATGPDVHRLSDAEYRYRWPRAIPAEYLSAGIYLTSLTPEQELAEFLAARAYCLVRNGRIAHGVAAMRWACRLAPHNSLRKAELDRLTAHLEVLRRGPYLNQPVALFPELPQNLGPRWVDTNDGYKALVQILKPEHMAPMAVFGLQSAANVGLSLQRCSVELPNGHHAWAEVPHQTSFRPMTAYWVELSPNEFALVHKPMTAMHRPVDVHGIGQPVLPEPQRRTWASQPPGMYRGGFGVRHVERQALMPWEESSINLAVEQMKREAVIASRYQQTLPA
jgi:hypothetical protein